MTTFGIGDVRPLIKGNLRFKARIPLIYQWGVRQNLVFVVLITIQTLKVWHVL
jgi:hypothetical protein